MVALGDFEDCIISAKPLFVCCNLNEIMPNTKQ